MLDSEELVQGCSAKELFLTFCKIHMTTPVQVPFFNKVVGKMDTPAQVFSCHVCKMFKKKLRIVASLDYDNSFLY